MRLNPYLHAAAAASYVGAVVVFLNFISSFRHDTPDTLIDSLGFISLLVCSAAVMAFLFFYQPLVLLLEHKKREAVVFFIKTLGTFAAFTLLLLVLVSTQ